MCPSLCIYGSYSEIRIRRLPYVARRTSFDWSRSCVIQRGALPAQGNLGCIGDNLKSAFGRSTWTALSLGTTSTISPFLSIMCSMFADPTLRAGRLQYASISDAVEILQ